VIEIRRILCPTDFSDTSRLSLDFAVAIAKWYDSTLTVLHVSAVTGDAFGASAALLPKVHLTPRERDHVLASIRQFVETEIGPTVSYVADLAEGSVADEIVNKAVVLPADLIVLGTHGYSGVDRLLLGSVTDKVLRKASCPVLTVAPHAPEAVPVPSALCRRILCAIDFSPCSMEGLTYALSLAQETNADLFVLSVWEHLPDEDPSTPPSPALRAYFESMHADRRSRLARAIPDAARTYCTIETIVGEGRAYREILRVADAKDADLIVIGVRGRGEIDRWLFGSTAQEVVRRATCPVLTIRTR
jgi:nucleotide-binding universal stress UspA family protein